MDLIKHHIQKIKNEKETLKKYKEYTDILHADNSMSDEVYKKIHTVINNRWYYLDKSISDHEKLLSNGD
jgi:arginyl-tRNA--protein-N-Asp/Glu arginylyltransferase